MALEAKIFGIRVDLTDEHYQQIKEIAEKQETKMMNYNNGILDVREVLLHHENRGATAGMVDTILEKINTIHTNDLRLSDQNKPVDVYNATGLYNDLFLKYDSRYVNYALTAYMYAMLYRVDIVKTSAFTIMEKHFFAGVTHERYEFGTQLEFYEEQAFWQVLDINDKLDIHFPDTLPHVLVEVVDVPKIMLPARGGFKILHNRTELLNYIYSIAEFDKTDFIQIGDVNFNERWLLDTVDVKASINEELYKLYSKYPEAVIEIQ